MRSLAALLLAGCAGNVAPASASLPPECVAPPGLACVAETLNDGMGPDDHRQSCDGGRWLFYPSGELWHIDGSTVLCHLGPGGAVLWAQE